MMSFQYDVLDTKIHNSATANDTFHSGHTKTAQTMSDNNSSLGTSDYS